MKNFSLRNILPAGDTDFSKGVYLLLFNATTVPPHLLLSIEGKIYSITDAGRQLGSPLDKLLLFIQRKNVPALFVEWKQLGSWEIEKLESLVQGVFLKYDRVVEEKVSCLYPIRDVVSAVLGSKMETADFIFELLPLMEKENSLGKIFELNMEQNVRKGEFELLTYSRDELNASLQSARSHSK